MNGYEIIAGGGTGGNVPGHPSRLDTPVEHSASSEDVKPFVACSPALKTVLRRRVPVVILAANMRRSQDYDELRCNLCPVSNSCIFSVLSGNDRQEIATKVHFLHYRDEETIFRQGERVRGLYVLCQGLVKMRFMSQQGRYLLIRFCRPGETLNGITLEWHVFSGVAVGAPMIGFINEVQLMWLIKQHPKLGLEMDHRFAQNGQHLLQRMADLAYESVEERLAHILLSLGRRHGVHEGKALRIDLPLSQQDLADMIGSSRQTVNRELRKLTDQGFIHEERCRITILDEERLRNLR